MSQAFQARTLISDWLTEGMGSRSLLKGVQRLAGKLGEERVAETLVDEGGAAGGECGHEGFFAEAKGVKFGDDGLARERREQDFEFG